MDNGWKIRETGFTPFEVKNEIFFHRVVVNHNQLTNSLQFDAVKVRSNAIIRRPYGKEIGIVIKLSMLVEMLPNEVLLTPTRIHVASHGPNVKDYNKRLVIPARNFHAIQIGTNAHKHPGVSYPPNEFSKKEWSEQADLIPEQLSIPNVLTQDIKTVHQYVKGFAMNYDRGSTSEVSTEFLSILSKNELSKTYMNARVPNRTNPKGKGKGKDKSKDDSVTPAPDGLDLLAPIEFPEDPGLQPEIPLYSPQQYWANLVRKQPMAPDYRGHNKIRCAYNTDPIQLLYDGTIRYLTPKGQNPTPTGVLEVPSILKAHPNSRGRNGNVPEHFNPFFQYSQLELVRMNTSYVHTPARFERWVVSPMVTMRYSITPFNEDGSLCHYFKQLTMWLNPCHFANKGCELGNNCRFAHCNQEIEFAERLLRTWGHESPHEA